MKMSKDDIKIRRSDIMRIFNCWKIGCCSKRFCRYRWLCGLFDRAYEEGFEDGVKSMLELEVRLEEGEL